MASTFEHITKVAVEEIVQGHVKQSKFGYFLSDQALPELVGDIVNLLVTSRALKETGDRFLASGGAPGPKNQAPRRGGGEQARGRLR